MHFKTLICSYNQFQSSRYHQSAHVVICHFPVENQPWKLSFALRRKTCFIRYNITNLTNKPTGRRLAFIVIPSHFVSRVWRQYLQAVLTPWKIKVFQIRIKKIQQPCSTSKCVGLHRVGATKTIFFYLSCYLAALVSNWCSWMGRPRRDPRTTPLQKQPRYCECLLPLN